MLKKAAVNILFTLLILFQAALLYAADQKVMVTPFESKTEDEALAKKATIISAREVMQSKGFIYVSPTAYVRAVVGDEKIVKNNSVDLEKEYSVKSLDEIEKMAKSNQTLDNFTRALQAADVAISGKAERSGKLVKIEPQIVSMKTQRTYSAVVECEEGRLNDELQKAVRTLLEKISKIEKIYADKLTDPERSKVIYVVKTMDKKEITMEFDYTSDRPNPQLQNANILPSEGLNKNGVTTLNVMSGEGKIVEINFNYKLGKLESVNVDTPTPDPSKNTKQSETLTLKSKAGYLLEFEFVWENGFMTTAKLNPKINPFGDAES